MRRKLRFLGENCVFLQIFKNMARNRFTFLNSNFFSIKLEIVHYIVPQLAVKI